MLVIGASRRDMYFSALAGMVMVFVYCCIKLYGMNQTGELQEIEGIAELYPAGRTYRVAFVGQGYSGQCDIPGCAGVKWTQVIDKRAIAKIDEAGKIFALRVGGVDVLAPQDVKRARFEHLVVLVASVLGAVLFFIFYRRGK